MLLLLLIGAGIQGPIVPPVRAYAAISFSLVNTSDLTITLAGNAEGSVS